MSRIRIVGQNAMVRCWEYNARVKSIISFFSREVLNAREVVVIDGGEENRLIEQLAQVLVELPIATDGTTNVLGGDAALSVAVLTHELGDLKFLSLNNCSNENFHVPCRAAILRWRCSSHFHSM